MSLIIGTVILLGVIFAIWKIIDWSNGRPCPECGYRVRSGDTICPNCQHSFLPKGKIQISTLRSLPAPETLEGGWKTDPLDAGQLRWWDGQAWEPKVGIREKASS